MAFGTTYGYKTNVSTVVAFAEGDEYETNPDYVDEGTTPGQSVPAVDLVLTGMSSGSARRKGVLVADNAAAAEANEAFVA